MSMNHVQKLLERWELLVSLNPDRKTRLVSAVNNLRKELDTPEDPQIIRTVEELEALDPDTLVFDGVDTRPADFFLRVAGREEGNLTQPLAVIATDEQVHAAQKALEEAE